MLITPNRSDPEYKMRKARGDLVNTRPFFGLLALGLEIKAINDPQVPIMGTDGKYLYYRPEAVAKLPQPHVLGIIAHEVLHCAFQHVFRRRYRNPDKWNRAADYAINSLVLKERLSLPKSRLHNSKYSNMSVEEIYTQLPDQPPPNTAGGGTDDWNFGACVDPAAGVKDIPGISQAEIDRRQQDWELKTQQAIHAAKLAGHLPEYLEHLVEEFFVPQIPWRQRLWHFCTKFRPGRISWNRPNRRLLRGYHSDGSTFPLVLPSRIPEPAGDFVVAYDTSGSISHEERVQFASEINQIHKVLQPEKLTVLYVDTKVHKIVEFAPWDTIEIQDIGGGGTAFQPAFDWVKATRPDMDAFIYLTDGYPNKWPEPIHSYPVLWCITNRVITPPWGEHLIIDFKD